MMPRLDIIAEVPHLKSYSFLQNTYTYFLVLAQLYANKQQNLEGSPIFFSFTMPSSAPSHSVWSLLYAHGYELGHTLHREQVQPWCATRSPSTLKHEEAAFWTAWLKSNSFFRRDNRHCTLRNTSLETKK